MRALALFAVLEVVSLNGVAQPWRLPDPPTAQQAYSQLLTVRRFAFGGVGYAGVTSEGDIGHPKLFTVGKASAAFSLAAADGE